jgi:hypothetical protein
MHEKKNSSTAPSVCFERLAIQIFTFRVVRQTRDQLENAFTLRGTNYRLHISIFQVTSFGISLFDDDLLERWVGEFSAPFIEDVTRKAGSARTAAVFWKMLQYAVAGSSPEISFDITSGQDVAARIRRGYPPRCHIST